MGRAGRGSSGGGSRSGSSRSGSRSGSGHRVSSSSRAGRGVSRSGDGHFHSSPGSAPRMPRPPRRHRRYHDGRGVYIRSGPGYTSILSTLLTYGIVFVIVLLALLPTLTDSFRSGGVSTIERHKLDSGNGFYSDCITDELGWFDNETKTESRLKEFYEETGVQPVILLKAYDASLKTDAQKEQWAEDYYEKYIDREDVFLYVYFCEKTESDVGYMYAVNGYETSSVMDSEAVSIFWNNIDRYWYRDISTDDVIVYAFNDTADTIMRVSTTGKDIVKWVIIAVVVIGGGIIVIKVMKKKREDEAARAAETERILNTPLEKMESDADALAEHYNNN